MPTSQKSSQNLMPNAEKCLLAACMLEPGALALAAQEINPDILLSERHRTIYKALLRLMQKGRQIDVVTLTDELGSKLQNIGGISVILDIMGSLPTAAHIQEYIEIVRRNHSINAIRQVGKQIEALADAAEQGNFEGDIYAEAQDRLLQVTSRQIRKKRIYTLGELIPERLEMYENGIKERSKVKTGFIELDFSLGGLGCGELIVIAARPGMGKTALALDIARYAAKQNNTVLFFSLEMSRDQIIDRLVAAEGHISLWKLRNQRMKDEDWQRCDEALQRLPSEKFLVDDTASITTGEMLAKSMAVKVQSGLDLIVIDYLGLIGDRAGAGRSRNDEVSQAVRNVKTIAKTLNVPVLLLSQLSREVEREGNKRPQLHHLRDSGEVEQTADVVIFIYRPAYYDKRTEEGNTAEIIIAKQRNGPTGTIKMAFLEEYTTFVPLERGANGA